MKNDRFEKPSIQQLESQFVNQTQTVNEFFSFCFTSEEKGILTCYQERSLAVVFYLNSTGRIRAAHLIFVNWNVIVWQMISGYCNSNSFYNRSNICLAMRVSSQKVRFKTIITKQILYRLEEKLLFRCPENIFAER